MQEHRSVWVLSNNPQYPKISHLSGPLCAGLMEFCCSKTSCYSIIKYHCAHIFLTTIWKSVIRPIHHLLHHHHHHHYCHLSLSEWPGPVPPKLLPTHLPDCPQEQCSLKALVYSEPSKIKQPDQKEAFYHVWLTCTAFQVQLVWTLSKWNCIMTRIFCTSWKSFKTISWWALETGLIYNHFYI